MVTLAESHRKNVRSSEVDLLTLYRVFSSEVSGLFEVEAMLTIGMYV